MKERIELAKSWFKVGDEDILTAEQLMRFEEPILRSICFHCQQAVEKYIKGYIIFLDGDFSYTHDISRLLDELKKYESGLSLDDMEPDQLSTYAIETRYPDPETMIHIDKARDAIAIAREVRIRILERINQ